MALSTMRSLVTTFILLGCGNGREVLIQASAYSLRPTNARTARRNVVSHWLWLRCSYLRRNRVRFPLQFEFRRVARILRPN